MMRRHLRPFIVPAVAVLIGTLSVAEQLRAQPSVIGEWSNVITWGSTPQTAIEAIHISMLPTGKVLFWQTWRESVGLWDPETGAFSAAAIPSYNVFCSGHTFLADGRLLVAGGHVENFNGENRADIYNPFTNTWSNMDPSVPDVPTMGPASSNTVARVANAGTRVPRRLATAMCWYCRAMSYPRALPIGGSRSTTPAQTRGLN